VTMLVLGLLIPIWWTREQQTGRVLALVALELLLPLCVGTVAAGLFAGDPALDLLLSTPQPPWHTLAQRLAVVLGWGAVLGLIVQGGTDMWELPLAAHGLSQVLIWATPMLFLTGVATAGALVRGLVTDGLIAILVVLGWALSIIPYIRRVCAQAPSEQCVAALVTPAMTLMRPLDRYWPLNRLIWLTAGLLLLAAGLVLTRREERLVQATRESEEG
jgi:hypothetical protein